MTGQSAQQTGAPAINALPLMTSHQRMALAMQNKQPDRVPVMCQLSWGHILVNTGISPSEFVYNPKAFAEGLWLMREKYHFDGILINQYANESEEFRKSMRVEVMEDGEMCHFPNGDRVLCLNYDNPRHYPINPGQPLEIDDVDVSEIAISTEVAPHRVECHKIIVEWSNKQFSVHGEVGSPFDELIILMGIENAFMGLMTDPAKCHEMLDRFLDKCFAFAKAQIQAGVDAMKISSPFVGGSMLSKEHYQEFVLPIERRLVDLIHELKPGLPVYTHTCGFIGDRLELMAETGIDGIECLDPAPLGNCELSDAKARIGKTMFIKGNMDSVNMLLQATPDSLEEYVKGMIRDGAQGGGYILSSACSVAPMVSPEIMKMLVPLAEKYGTYPLSEA